MSLTRNSAIKCNYMVSPAAAILTQHRSWQSTLKNIKDSEDSEFSTSSHKRFRQNPRIAVFLMMQLCFKTCQAQVVNKKIKIVLAPDYEHFIS